MVIQVGTGVLSSRPIQSTLARTATEDTLMTSTDTDRRSCANAFALVLICVLLFSGCSLFENDPGDVAAASDDEHVIIENHRRDTIWAIQFGRTTSAVVNWAPAVGQGGIPPCETRVVPLHEIIMGDDEEEVVIYWWEAVVEDRERKPGEVLNLTVEIGD